jgi:hypothetical protein
MGRRGGIRLQDCSATHGVGRLVVTFSVYTDVSECRAPGDE